METQRRGAAEMKVPRELACSLGFFGDYVTLLKARAGDPSTQDDASRHEWYDLILNLDLLGDTLGGPPHPVIVTIRDNRDYIRVLLYSYTTITG